MKKSFLLYCFLELLFYSSLLSNTEAMEENDPFASKVVIKPYRPQEQNPDLSYLSPHQNLIKEAEAMKGSPVYYSKERNIYYSIDNNDKESKSLDVKEVIRSQLGEQFQNIDINSDDYNTFHNSCYEPVTSNPILINYTGEVSYTGSVKCDYKSWTGVCGHTISYKGIAPYKGSTEYVCTEKKHKCLCEQVKDLCHALKEKDSECESLKKEIQELRTTLINSIHT